VTIIGICGGYQMLGQSISDPEGSEGEPGRRIAGMGLLPMDTTFASAKSKHRSRVSATALPVRGSLANLTGAAVEGYEIHMGESTVAANNALLQLQDGRLDGCQSGNIYGSYLHGFFDSSESREAILNSLATAKGADFTALAFNYANYKEQQYDLLAKGVREALNMPLIYRILEQGV
jgi:adenosylcobyric acid synthase